MWIWSKASYPVPPTVSHSHATWGGQRGATQWSKALGSTATVNTHVSGERKQGHVPMEQGACSTGKKVSALTLMQEQEWKEMGKGTLAMEQGTSHAAPLSAGSPLSKLFGRGEWVSSLLAPDPFTQGPSSHLKITCNCIASAIWFQAQATWEIHPSLIMHLFQIVSPLGSEMLR